MSQSEKVLRYDLPATDGSGRRLVQYALPGSDFETAESLEADGLIEREFMASGQRRGSLRQTTYALQFGNSTSMNKIASTADPCISPT